MGDLFILLARAALRRFGLPTYNLSVPLPMVVVDGGVSSRFKPVTKFQKRL